MKRLLFLALLPCALYSAQEITFDPTVCAPDARHWKPSYDETLKDTLAPHGQVLSYKTVDSGMPVYAMNVEIGSEGQKFVHRARYLNAEITTVFGTAKTNGASIGEQIVSINKGDSVVYKSMSSDWEKVTIDCSDYIVHHHAHFKVYSSCYSQYVISY